MSQQAAGAPGADAGAPLVSPWLVLGGGWAAVALGWAWSLATPEGLALRGWLVVAGLIAVGAALSLGVRRLGSTLEQRLLPAAMAALAGVAALVGRWAVEPGWDSLGLLFGFLGLVGLVGAGLILMPWPWRGLALSAVAVVHLGGIVTAVLTVPPPGGPPSWLASQAFLRYYRPWLQFTNLNNGYHFYAPEPGGQSLLWFRVQYADGTARWVKLPDHKECQTGLETRRMGALSTTWAMTVAVPPGQLRELAEKREKAGREHKPPIPMGAMPPDRQYSEPTAQAKMLLESFVRFVARTTSHPSDPGQEVTGVKVYRVEYTPPPPRRLVEGYDMLDPTFYLVYYQGDYDAEGRIKPECLTIHYFTEGPRAGIEATREQDPFLYWLLPIWRVPLSGEVRTDVPPDWMPPPGESRVVNYVRIHAGDKETEANP